MYENVTYEQIIKRMLDKIPSAFDKREGSIIYDAIAPAAIELQLMYIELDIILRETFADTASREYLIKRVGERGITPKSATNAVLKGIFSPTTIDVQTGLRFTCNDLNYAVQDKIKDGQYRLICEKTGNIGNGNFGNLIPINYIKGLERAELTEILIPGEDEEDTEHLRQRYYDSLSTEAFGGSSRDYEEKINAIPGVGGCKVYPVWNGGGTVKVVIIASDFSVPTQTLTDKVQTVIDPVQNHGQGAGIAPIGHVVTVEGVTDFKVNITTHLTLQTDWIWEDVKEYAEKAVDVYLNELSEDWSSNENLIVRISQLETRLLNLPGAIDIYDTLINGKGQNLQLEKNCIPIRGDISG